MYPNSFPQYIGDARRIFVGRVVEARYTNKQLMYKFDVLEWIRSPPADKSLKSVERAIDAWYHGKGVDLYNHSGLGFWNGLKSGVPLSSDCSYIPNLRIGVEYLVIEGAKPTGYDFEVVYELWHEDYWYRYVAATSAGQRAYPFAFDELEIEENELTEISCKVKHLQSANIGVSFRRLARACIEAGSVADSVVFIRKSILGEDVLLPVKGNVVMARMADLFELPRNEQGELLHKDSPETAHE